MDAVMDNVAANLSQFKHGKIVIHGTALDTLGKRDQSQHLV
jgi:hypothetical protein